MTKFSLITLSAAALLLASCSNDDDLLNGENGTPTQVSFSVTAPVELSTRAVNDGTKATHLTVAVFDADGNFVYQQDRGQAFASGKTQVVNVDLVTGKSYIVAFWVDAPSPSSPYTIIDGKLTINYDGALANDDYRDAFYAAKEITVESNQPNQDITLTRPFAQVNLGTSDYNTVKNLFGFAPTTTAVTITGCAYKEMNLAKGNVMGEVVDVTFASALMPDYDEDEGPASLTAGGTTYSWIGMNYVLCDAAGGTISEISFYTDVDGIGERTYSSGIPVKRNFRSNLCGSLFTTSSGWKVTVDPGVSDFITVGYNSTLSALENGTILRDAIQGAADGATIYVPAGTYEINATNASGGIQIKEKSISIIGADGAVINDSETGSQRKTFYITGMDGAGNDMNVVIKNLVLNEIQPQKASIWMRGNVNVTLDEVTCVSAIIDNEDNNTDVINLDLKNCNIGTLTVDAHPFGASSLNTYSNVTYDNATKVKFAIQSSIKDEGLSHITLNGVVPQTRGWYYPVDTVAEIEAALAEYNTDSANAAGNYTLLVADGTYNMNETVQQFAGKNLAIIGVNPNQAVLTASTGTVLLIDGNSSYDTGTLTIEDVAFDVTGGLYGIQFGSGSDLRYASGITVNNCKFTGSGYGIQSGSGSNAKNVTVKNCEANGLNTFITAYVENLTVDKCTVNADKGINNQQSGVTMTNSSLNVSGYGIRINSGVVNTSNSSIATTSLVADIADNKDACIVLRGTLATANLNNSTTLNGPGFYATVSISKSAITGAPADATYYGSFTE